VSRQDAANGTRPELPSRRIARELREAIESGDLAAGQQVPTERELAARYQVARNTAREAIRLLAEAGLVDAEHGRGVFVRRPEPLIRLGNQRYARQYRDAGLSPFLLECAKQGKAGRFEVLHIDRHIPPDAVADDLGLPRGERNVLTRENIFWAGGDPVHRVTTWIPWHIADGSGLLEEDIPHPYGIHGILEQLGHAMARMDESVQARMPTQTETTELRLRPGVPVLDVRHVSIDQDGARYEVTRFVMRGDMTGLAYNIPVE
jgi:GntR family transcriptional regulator